MAIRWPDANAEIGTNNNLNGLRLTIPTAVLSKPAATGYVTLFFFRTMDASPTGSDAPTIISRQGGSSGGADGYIRFSSDGLSINYNVFQSGASQHNISVTGLSYSTNYMGILICTAANTHLAVCPVGGTATYTSATTNQNYGYSTNMSTAYPWNAIGSGTANASKAATGYLLENVCMWTGDFPETSNVPDLTLIANLASGTQSLDTIHSTYSWTRKFKYALSNAADLSEAWAGGNALTKTNESTTTGRILYSSGPIRPSAITPARTMDCISQAVFATPGTMASAVADIKIEGGSYTGLPTMSKMQARLLDSTNTQVRTWIDLTTTAPVSGAGTWAASAGFLAVPMQAGFMRVEFRALDSGSTVIAGPVAGYGLRGVGLHGVFESQSQFNQAFVGVGNGLALTTNANAIVTKQAGNADIPANPDTGEAFVPATAQKTTQYIMSAADTTLTRGAAYMARQIVNEWNALYPGVPIQMSAVGQNGTALDIFSDYGNPGVPGLTALRWAGLKDGLGIVQPFYMLFCGHSASGDSNTYGKMAAVVAWMEPRLGVPLKTIHVPVSRYKAAGTNEFATGNAKAVGLSRSETRRYCDDNPLKHVYTGSLAHVFTGMSSNVETGGSNPHSDGGIYGQGRMGTQIALAWMQVCRAVPDEPLTLRSATKISTTGVKLNFGRTNPRGM